MKKKILIIDDDPLILDLVDLAFSGFAEGEFDVLKSANGIEGIERIKEGDIDVVLLDVMMPAINGYQVCKELKADPKTSNVKVIMLSARAQKDEIEKGFDCGADDYITKPFDPKILVEKIREMFK